MGTNLRPEPSEKNPYWIERHRYYELKHFCMQYPVWKKLYSVLDGLSKNPQDMAAYIKSSKVSNPTEKCAEEKLRYSKKMEMLENCAIETDIELGDYVLKGVTEGIPYDILKLKYNIPCAKNTYYNAYRRFFWLLNKKRDEHLT